MKIIQTYAEWNRKAIMDEIIKGMKLHVVEQLSCNLPLDNTQLLLAQDVCCQNAMTITDKIVPNLVGVDIGCGMEVIKVKEKHLELQVNVL